MSNVEAYLKVLETEKQVLQAKLADNTQTRTLLGQALLDKEIKGIKFCINMAEHMLKEKTEPVY